VGWGGERGVRAGKPRREAGRPCQSTHHRHAKVKLQRAKELVIALDEVDHAAADDASAAHGDLEHAHHLFLFLCGGLLHTSPSDN